MQAWVIHGSYMCQRGQRPLSCLSMDPSSLSLVITIPLNEWASLGAQLVKNLPAMRETWVRSLGWEDPLEKGKAIHSSILAWRIYSPWSHKESNVLPTASYILQKGKQENCLIELEENH